MHKPALDKIYVILGDQDKGQLEGLCKALSGLFSYVNLTSNLYLVGKSLSEGMSQVERVHKTVRELLRENLFARLHVHFVHGVAIETTKDVDFSIQYYYQGWKRFVHEFDQEGFMHQEIPRLMLLPVIVPHNKAESRPLIRLLEALKEAFLLPCVYLAEDTFYLAQDEDLVAKSEKVYYGIGVSGAPAEIVRNLCWYDIVEEMSSNLESNVVSMGESCTPGLIISAQDGNVYGCVEAFLSKESLGNIHGDLDVDSMMAEYLEQDESKKRCFSCKGRAIQAFAGLPLPKKNAQEIGALLYRLGTSLQESGDYAAAVEVFKTSLGLSPEGEAGSIHFRLGLCCTKIGAFDLALESFGRAEATYMDQYYFHFYVGLCLYEKGDLHGAVERLSRAMEMDPQGEDLVRILIYVGTCYNGLGEYREALGPLERAKEAVGSVKEIFSTLGFSYFQLQDYDRAIENLRTAVELDPTSAMDYASLGANYREKGDIANAVSMFEKALDLDQTLVSARENLERLKGDV